MSRFAELERKTKETQVRVRLDLDMPAEPEISTGIGFLDHMLTLFAVHGFFGLAIQAQGDLEVDNHHTVEDIGIVLGQAFDKALGDRKSIRRYGHAVTPMDEALAAVSVDFSRRPYLVFHVPSAEGAHGGIDAALAKEFFRALAHRGGLNLHINVSYGENWHHIIEAVFKAAGRAMDEAVAIDARIGDVRSSKGAL
jgi:imidazoleglycerol-phosphate dehydratase